ncbi:hypothetical protein HGRIS_013710 [Hohenbuehelia grisea]|uniref:Dolichyl-diphosphooligosaccharide--protein glycosyltransferase subunit WBP1 n=1 Tax=Hohenbuehelia grisea TaxID=104357 RepID=A0ABR3IWM4_9AGAR
MVSLRAVLWPLLALAGLASAKSSSGDNVLVILEPALDKSNFSIFFDGLKERGYKLTFRAPKSVTPQVIQDEVATFNHVVIFAPETKAYAQDITPQSLVQLLSLNTNLLIALSPKQTPLTSLALEFSLIPPPPGTPLVSHFPERDTPATIVPVRVPSSNPILSTTKAPVWFSGASHALGNNPRLVPILRAPAESFAADSTDDSGSIAVADAAEKGGEGLWAGSQMGLVTGFQVVGGARATWVGGVSVFSDEFAKKEISKGKKSGNQQFAQDVAAWTFQESLVLRIDRTEHHRVNETEPLEQYTTNDMITFTARISKYDGVKERWESYSGLKDLQLEFTMLDPFIRTALSPVAGKPGIYSATFRAPDRHGVFKFVIDYKRKGFTQLHSSTTVSVVPPRHDGYPRFLSAAWPYYAGAISTSIGFLLFSTLWLAGDVREMLMKKGKGLKRE